MNLASRELRMINVFKHPIKFFRSQFKDEDPEEIPEREFLPEIILNIFKHLDFSHFESCFLINRKWSELTKEFVRYYIPK